MNLKQFTQYYRQSLIEMIYESINCKQKTYTEILKCAEQIYQKSQKHYVDSELEDLLNRLKVMLQFSNQDISSHIDLALQQIQIAKRINLKIAPKTLSEYSEDDEQEDQLQIEEKSNKNTRRMEEYNLQLMSVQNKQPKIHIQRNNKDINQNKEKSMSIEQRSLSPKKAIKPQINHSNDKINKNELLQKKKLNQKRNKGKDLSDVSSISEENSQSGESTEGKSSAKETMNEESMSKENSLSKESSTSSDKSLSEDNSFYEDKNKKQQQNNNKESNKKLLSKDAQEEQQPSNMKDEFKKYLQALLQIEENYDLNAPKKFRDFDYFVKRKNRSIGYIQELDGSDRKFVHDLYNQNIDALTQRQIGKLVILDPRIVSKMIIQHKQDEGMSVSKVTRSRIQKSSKSKKKQSNFKSTDSDDDDNGQGNKASADQSGFSQNILQKSLLETSQQNSNKRILRNPGSKQQTNNSSKQELHSESDSKKNNQKISSYEQRQSSQQLNNDKIDVKLEENYGQNETAKPLSEVFKQAISQQENNQQKSTSTTPKKAPVPSKTIFKKNKAVNQANKSVKRVISNQKGQNVNPNQSMQNKSYVKSNV